MTFRFKKAVNVIPGRLKCVTRSCCYCWWKNDSLILFLCSLTFLIQKFKSISNIMFFGSSLRIKLSLLVRNRPNKVNLCTVSECLLLGRLSRSLEGEKVQIFTCIYFKASFGSHFGKRNI